MRRELTLFESIDSLPADKIKEKKICVAALDD